MENMESTWVAFRKIGWLALLGFGVIVLSGPLLAVLSVLLSVGAVVLCFALVGFMVWSIFQFAIHGQEAASESIQAMSQNATRVIGKFGQTTARILAFPFKVIVRDGDGSACGRSRGRAGWDGPSQYGRDRSNQRPHRRRGGHAGGWRLASVGKE